MKEKKKKDRKLSLRLSKEEHEKLVKQATKKSLPVTSFIRMILSKVI